MANFRPNGKAPGVYIEEVLVPGPIPGVSTSVAAFIGPARTGPIREPVEITSYLQFAQTFGLRNARNEFDPFVPTAPVYVTAAVKGFFDNGGTRCFFTRVSTAQRAGLPLADRSAGAGTPSLLVRARTEGGAGNNITVAVADASVLAGATVEKPAATTLGAATAIGDTQVTLASAAAAAVFNVGDTVAIEEGANADRLTIGDINGAVVTVAPAVAHAYTAAAAVRIADLAAGQRQFRVSAIGGVEPGTVLRLTQNGAATTETAVVQSVDPTTRFVTLAGGLANAYLLSAANTVDVVSVEFSITINTPNQPALTLTNLSMDPRHRRYVVALAARQADRSVDILLADPPTSTPPPNNMPRVVNPAVPLQNGNDEHLDQIGTADYLAAITGLEPVDEVNLLCIPDRTDTAVQSAMIAHCESMQDRFAILDPPPNLTLAQIRAHRQTLQTERGFGALYYPQVYIQNPLADGLLKVPPSGHLAGVYARTDDQKGVHKAPANETIRGVLELERVLSDNDQGPLNDDRINVIRSFPDRGMRVWGARTLSPATDTQWQYVNVRRLLLFIEESIQEGTQFAVFSPNNTELRQAVKRQVEEFLDRVWRTGGLVGDKPNQAYRVRVDDELNPPASVALGQLTIEVRVAPTTPAEFIVFMIIQEPGRPIVAE